MKADTINLTTALEIFEPHLDDILDAQAVNVTHKLEALPPLPASDDEHVNWVWSEVRKLEVEAITDIPLKVIRRIQSLKYYQTVYSPNEAERITEEDILRAKEVPIEEIFEGQLKRSGNKLWGKFRDEDTASFCVHPDNRWSDFGDSIHGDSIDLYQKIHNVDFISAVKLLINKV